MTSSINARFTQPLGSVYVTGTDTGIGKTVVSLALLQTARAARQRVAGFKPVAAGCVMQNGQWCNEDALALQQESWPVPAYAHVNPYPLPLPTAPQLAARACGQDVQLAQLQAAYQQLQAQADVVVCEGAGGWAAPFSDTLEQADVVKALGLPVVLVVGMRLGCLSHARLSARAIIADGCTLLGWIANAVEPDFDSEGSYHALLVDALPVPCIGQIGWQF